MYLCLNSGFEVCTCCGVHCGAASSLYRFGEVCQASFARGIERSEISYQNAATGNTLGSLLRSRASFYLTACSLHVESLAGCCHHPAAPSKHDLARMSTSRERWETNTRKQMIISFNLAKQRSSVSLSTPEDLQIHGKTSGKISDQYSSIMTTINFPSSKSPLWCTASSP